jgi:hypothetical protein
MTVVGVCHNCGDVAHRRNICDSKKRDVMKLSKPKSQKLYSATENTPKSFTPKIPENSPKSKWNFSVPKTHQKTSQGNPKKKPRPAHRNPKKLNPLACEFHPKTGIMTQNPLSRDKKRLRQEDEVEGMSIDDYDEVIPMEIDCQITIRINDSPPMSKRARITYDNTDSGRTTNSGCTSSSGQVINHLDIDFVHRPTVTRIDTKEKQVN